MKPREITIFGESKTVSEWMQDSRCNCERKNVFYWRVRKGWSYEDALIIPARGYALKEKCTTTDWHDCLDCKFPECRALSKPVMDGETKDDY